MRTGGQGVLQTDVLVMREVYAAELPIRGWTPSTRQRRFDE